MRVLVACEFSGTVRDAFIAKGHDAVSCDLLPTEKPGPHIHGDVLPHLGDGWDLLVGHPPCTHLSVSGARWATDHWVTTGDTKRWHDGSEKRRQRKESLAFVQALMDAPIPCIAIENPISIISSNIRKPDQIIQPWMFGHGETKATCLWLKNLPKLQPTNIVEGREAVVHKMPPGPDRWKKRSTTYQGIAEAMASQWNT